MKKETAIFLTGFLLLFSLSCTQKEHSEHTQGDVPGTVPFTVEQMAKLKPGEICVIHKCKMGTCYLVVPEEAAKLGKCPHCGEDLKKIYETAVEEQKNKAEGRASMTLSPEKQQYLGVKLGRVKRGRLEREISTVGRIAFDPDLYLAQQEFKAALESANEAKSGSFPEAREMAESNLKAIKTRLRILGLSEEQIQKMEEHPHEDTSLILPGTKGDVWVYATVYEYELPYLKSGQPILAKVPSIPGKEFHGTIQAIDTVLNPQTRTAKVRALLENQENLLRPEMYINAVIKIDLGESLLVPNEAVFKTGKDNIVFVSTGEGRYEPRSVVLGVEGEEGVEVKSGLEEGEEIVLSGNFLIDSESRLKAALGTMGKGHGGGQHS